jgi:uncharacterized protein
MEPDVAEIRVLGCLIEKQRTTPDVYPLTLNALRLACNQSTNRDPVVDLSEAEIRGALDRLVHRKWATLASWSNRRAMKYRHTLDRAIELDEREIALLCVLMLRGPQTPGELKTRTERLRPFEGVAEVQAMLDRLIERQLVERLGRRPGQREERYAQLLGAAGEEEEGAPPSPSGAPRAPTPPAASAPASAPEPGRSVAPQPSTPPGPADGLGERLERLEREVADLRSQITALRNELGA